MKLPAEAEVQADVCPVCGALDPFREIGAACSTQPFALSHNGGEALSVRWDEMTYGGDVDDLYVECGQCMAQWRDVDALHRELMLVAFVRWSHQVAHECIAAINRTTNIEMFKRIEREAQAEGSRLDTRDLTRPDPEPFIRERMITLAEASLAEVTV